MAGNEGKILFVRVGAISARTVVVYAIKSFLQVTVFALEPVKGAEMEMGLTTSASAGANSKGSVQARGRGGFRSFGSVSPFERLWICRFKGAVLIRICVVQTVFSLSRS